MDRTRRAVVQPAFRDGASGQVWCADRCGVRTRRDTQIRRGGGASRAKAPKPGTSGLVAAPFGFGRTLEMTPVSLGGVGGGAGLQ